MLITPSKLALAAGVLLALALTLSCSSDDSPHKSAVKKRITGISQKGPFAEGSNVTIYELNEKLEKTKNTFKGKTDSKGYFEIEVDELASPYIMLKVNGRYFNEVSGTLSSVPITLNALADVSEESEANINALTHLEHERVLKLVRSGKDFEAAKQQAQKEVLGALGISVSGLINSESMNILGSSASDSVLLLVSILLQGGRTAGELVHLLTDFGSEIRDSGSVGESVKAHVSDGLRDVDMGKVSENIKDLSPDAKVPDISPFLPPEEPPPPSSSSRPPSSNSSGGTPSSNSAYSPPSQGGGGYVPPAVTPTPSSSSAAPPQPEWGDWVQTKAPTCESAGEETRTNDLSQTETRSIAQLEWGEWEITKHASQDAHGEETRTCPAIPPTTETRPLYKCGTVEYDPEEEFCQSSGVVKELCGTATYGATQMCHYGKVKSYFTDERDGKKYPYVEIGTQTWMAENLNYNASGSMCYDNDPANCDTYGRLYDWATAMALDVSCNTKYCASQITTPHHQGICPAGWHLPSDAEWTTLTDFVGGESTAGTKLKAASVWNPPDDTYDGTPAGTDNFGFAALPSGFVNSGGSYLVGVCTHWLSATESEYHGYQTYNRYMDNNHEDVVRNGVGKGGAFVSFRCLKD